MLFGTNEEGITMSTYTGADFYKYRNAYIVKLARNGFEAREISTILQAPTGHKWVDERHGEVMRCQDCSQEITLYRSAYDELKWNLKDPLRWIDTERHVLPCATAVMRRALL